MMPNTAKAGESVGSINTRQVVRSTYLKVLIIQAVVLAGLWYLQQAFL